MSTFSKLGSISTGDTSESWPVAVVLKTGLLELAVHSRIHDLVAGCLESRNTAVQHCP